MFLKLNEPPEHVLINITILYNREMFQQANEVIDIYHQFTRLTPRVLSGIIWTNMSTY